MSEPKGSTDAEKKDGQEAGDFGNVRRRPVRRRSTASAEDRKARAAAVAAAAEDVAGAGFLGTPDSPGGSVAPAPAEGAAVAVVDPPSPRNMAVVPAPTAAAEEITHVAEQAAADEPSPAATERSGGTALPAALGQEQPTGGPAQDAKQMPARSTSTRRAPRIRNTARPYDEMQPVHRRLHESFEDSRTNSRSWETVGANMIPPVWDGLRRRIAQDRRSSDNRELAAGHYMDVVFRNAPLDPDTLIRAHQELSARLMGRLGRGEKSTFRLSPAASQRQSEMKELLDEVDYARKGLYVVSALALAYLTELNDAGPLPKLELPSLL